MNFNLIGSRPDRRSSTYKTITLKYTAVIFYRRVVLYRWYIYLRLKYKTNFQYFYPKYLNTKSDSGGQKITSSFYIISTGIIYLFVSKCKLHHIRQLLLFILAIYRPTSQNNHFISPGILNWENSQRQKSRCFQNVFIKRNVYQWLVTSHNYDL